jgi:hypothetical protein
MGTSSRHPGPNDRSPLIPPHADAEPGKPLPKPQEQRFRQFRTNLGSYVKSGEKKALNKSLNSYAREATAGVGPRRFGNVIGLGGLLIATLLNLNQLQGSTDSIETPPDDSNVDTDFTEVVGQPLDVAIQILADKLTPPGEDSDRNRAAIVQALSESLQDMQDVFDPSLLSADILSLTLIFFLAEAIFQDILFQSGEAFEKAIPAKVIQERETDVRETIKAAVDKHIAKSLKKGVTGLTIKNLKKIQYDALKDVFSEWGEIKE